MQVALGGGRSRPAGLTRAPQSEYVRACDERRAFLSGFTGSAGTAVVTATDALLWTDGRYFEQAASQLSGEWTLMKSGTKGVKTVHVRARAAGARRVSRLTRAARAGVASGRDGRRRGGCRRPGDVLHQRGEVRACVRRALVRTHTMALGRSP